MYAARRVYVKQWDFDEPEERYTVQIARGGKPVSGIQTDRISAVEEEVMYWRKANHIHAWFVQNVQNGQDDCKEYFVDFDQIFELLVLCKKVIKASKLVKGQVVVSRRWNSKHHTWDELREPGKVIEDTTIAEKLLPATEGVFFGSTEYDEIYLDEVIRTRDWAFCMMADHNAGVPGDIYYSSSW
jgi:hypothetical protein